MITRPFHAAVIAAALVATSPPVAAQSVRPTIDRNVAVLQGLDKITARVSEIEVPVGDVTEFGTLTITVRACRSTPPEQAPEDAAFLQVADEPPGGVSGEVFSGWMFASSPAVSALEHPVYDVWVVECADALSPPETADEEYERGVYSLPDEPPLPPVAPEEKAP